MARRIASSATAESIFTHFLRPAIIYYFVILLSMNCAPTLTSSIAMAVLRMTGVDILSFLRSVVGSTMYEELPVPREWDAVNRPHVVLLDSVGDRLFCFFISCARPEDDRLSVMDLRSARSGMIVEVRHSALDHRYYRREGESWRLVAGIRDRFLMEVYDRGDSPVIIPLSGDLHDSHYRG